MFAVVFRLPSIRGMSVMLLMLVCIRNKGFVNRMEGTLSGPFSSLMDERTTLRGIYVILFWCEILGVVASVNLCIAPKQKWLCSWLKPSGAEGYCRVGCNVFGNMERSVGHASLTICNCCEYGAHMNTNYIASSQLFHTHEMCLKKNPVTHHFVLISPSFYPKSRTSLSTFQVWNNTEAQHGKVTNTPLPETWDISVDGLSWGTGRQWKVDFYYSGLAPNLKVLNPF